MRSSTRRLGRALTPVVIVFLLSSGAAPASASIAQLPKQGLWGTNGRVWAIARVDNVVYLGGDFTAAVGPRGQHVPRAHLMAITAATGALTSWNPGANGSVFSLAVRGSTIWAGGDFTRVKGATRLHVAGVTVGGRLAPLRVNAGALVHTVAVVGSMLYLGGRFGKVNNQHRSHLAAVNLTTGRLTSWHPSVNRAVRVLQPLPTGQLLIGGVFTQVNGRSERYLAIFRANGTLGDWALHPDPGRWVEDIAEHDGQIAVAEAGQGGRVQVFNAQGREQWRVFCNGDVQAVAFADDKVIVGGHFLTVDLKPAPRLAALTLHGTLVTTWHPLPDKPVWALRGSPQDVYVGGEFERIAQGGRTVAARHVAEFPLG